MLGLVFELFLQQEEWMADDLTCARCAKVIDAWSTEYEPDQILSMLRKGDPTFTPEWTNAQKVSKGEMKDAFHEQWLWNIVKPVWNW